MSWFVRSEIGRKGINALEIVFAMFILIVVTLVVIRLFTTTVTRETLPNIEDFRKTYNYDKEKSKCNNLCSSYQSENCELSAAVNYCQQKISIDIDGNFRTNERNHGGLIAGVPYCEDGLYCFHITSCECGSILDAKTCLEIMKEYYVNQLGLSEDEAKQIIVNKITPGTCDRNPARWGVKFYQGYKPIKPSDEECRRYRLDPGCNLPSDWWWWKAGYGDIAQEIGVLKGGISPYPLFYCISGDRKIECKWVGCPLGKIHIFLSDGSVYEDEDKPIGDVIFGPLNKGSYSAVLVCGGKTASSGLILID
ncbi:MAG: hypothetical protein QXG39_07865 [Candidatus Aenigmatarchaeota archaeon]